MSHYLIWRIPQCDDRPSGRHSLDRSCVLVAQISLGEVLWRAEVRVEPPTSEEPQRIAAITLKAETKQHVPQVQACVIGLSRSAALQHQL